MSFEWYVENELEPALEWIDTPDGKDFVSTYFSDIYSKIYGNREDMLFSNYIFTFKNIPNYIGEAIKPWKRLVVHLWHLRYEPKKYFGVETSELKYVKYKLLGDKYSDTKERQDMEITFRQEYCPVLNPAILRNKCISKPTRYKQVHLWYNDWDKLSMVMELLSFVDYKIPGSEKALDNTLDSKLPYGLEQRISMYIDSLNRNSRKELLHKLSLIAGKDSYVHTNTAIKMLARTLSGYKTKEKLVRMFCASTVKGASEARLSWTKLVQQANKLHSNH